MHYQVNNNNKIFHKLFTTYCWMLKALV